MCVCLFVSLPWLKFILFCCCFWFFESNFHSKFNFFSFLCIQPQRIVLWFNYSTIVDWMRSAPVYGGRRKRAYDNEWKIAWSCLPKCIYTIYLAVAQWIQNVLLKNKFVFVALKSQPNQEQVVKYCTSVTRQTFYKNTRAIWCKRARN